MSIPASHFSSLGLHYRHWFHIKLIFRPQGMGLLVLLKPGSPIAQPEWALLDGSGESSWETRARTACMPVAGVGMSVPILEAVARIPHNTHRPSYPRLPEQVWGPQVVMVDTKVLSARVCHSGQHKVFGVNAKDASLPSGSFWGAT